MENQMFDLGALTNRNLEHVPVVSDLGVVSNAIDNQVDASHIVTNESVRDEWLAVRWLVVADSQAVRARIATRTTAVRHVADADGVLGRGVCVEAVSGGPRDETSLAVHRFAESGVGRIVSEAVRERVVPSSLPYKKILAVRGTAEDGVEVPWRSRLGASRDLAATQEDHAVRAPTAAVRAGLRRVIGCRWPARACQCGSCRR